MRIKQTKVYQYDELSNKAKERARDWFRQDYPDHGWWDSTYEDIAQRAEELGIDLRQKPVKLMNGSTRYDPEIYFSGFYHQGSGSSFSGHWQANKMKLDKLKENCPNETELHRIGDTLTELAKEDPELSAKITAKNDNWINVEVCDGEIETERLNEYEYDSPEYKAYEQILLKRGDNLIEALRDFNHWIYRQLEKEYEYLTSDEQVEELIIANEYEFDEKGRRA